MTRPENRKYYLQFLFPEVVLFPKLFVSKVSQAICLFVCSLLFLVQSQLHTATIRIK